MRWNGWLTVLALLSIAACSENSQGGQVTVHRSPAPTLTLAEYQRSLPIPSGWPAPVTPPEGCDLPEITTRGNSSGIELGPVLMSAGSRLEFAVNNAAKKKFWIVEPEAGSTVTIEARRIEDRTPLLWWYESEYRYIAKDQFGVDRLTLSGPFDGRDDGARGALLATAPGCYELVVTWDGGSASAHLWVSREP